MLSGRRAFAGDTVTDILAAVLRADPDWTALPAGTPHRLRVLVRRCLERDPQRRLRHIGVEARIALEDVIADPAEDVRPAVVAMPASPRRTWPWYMALVSVGVLGIAAGRFAMVPTSSPSRPVRFEISAGAVESAVLSPDGTALAIVSQDQLWVRDMARVETRALQKTEGAVRPFWSWSHRPRPRAHDREGKTAGRIDELRFRQTTAVPVAGARLLAMSTAAAAPSAVPRPQDQRVFLNDVSWEDFELILRIRGDQAGVRVTYLDGVLELMTPSIDHEGIKKTIARLLEAYAEERGLPFNGFGSWTLKNAARKSALEPDECYSLSLGRPTSPDLAIEVVWTSGGIDKLDVYLGLRVREVWFWRDGVIEVTALAGDRYERRERSELLPDLDLAELARYIDPENQTDSVRRYRTALRGGTG
jgi:Uma2 family endonuclease